MSAEEPGASSPSGAPAQQRPGFLTRHRGHILKIGIEIFVLVLGVTVAFALENWRAAQAEADYRRQMMASLNVVLDEISHHSAMIRDEIDRNAATFDAALARGEHPAPPVYRESGGERPPVLVWDGLVATGVARSLEPEKFFSLAMLFNRLGSFGERYVRYTQYAEQRVLPLMGGDTAPFYTDAGALRGEYREYMRRQSELAILSGEVADQARQIRQDLERQARR